MQIHQLPEQQTVADSDMFALDTGQTTRRTPFSAIKTAISTFAHQLTNLTETTATSDSDVMPIDGGTGAKKITFGNLKNKITQDATPAFNSADAASPTSWTSVAVLTSGEALTSVYNKISAMFKNVRFIYSKLGSTNISDISDGTVTSAISMINDKTSWKSFTQSTEAAFLAAVDSAIGGSNGYLLGYMSAGCSSAAGLSNEMHYVIVVANSINARMLFVLRPTGTLYTRYKSSGTWTSGWKYVTLNTLT